MNSKKDKNNKQANSSELEKNISLNIQSDALFKKILIKPEPAKAFLKTYLPEKLLEIVNLETVEIQPDSYIEENLKKSFSDIVYEIQTHTSDKAFVYVLLEHQSKPDPWMALRLWQYILRLCERHRVKNKARSLPLVYPIVFYNGKPKYSSARNLWDLFASPKLAKDLLTSDYKLIDLQSTSDDEIKKKKHIALLEFFMKHIHMRDMIKLWRRVLTEFKQEIYEDRLQDFELLSTFVWYTDTKLEKQQEKIMTELFKQHLSHQDGENLMPTIAEHYMQKGIEKGILDGIQKGVQKGRQDGIQEGLERGLERGLEKSVLGMLSKDLDLKLISDITGLSMSKIKALKNGIKK